MQTFSSIEIDQFLEQVVRSVFESMLLIEVTPVVESWPPADLFYTAVVDFGASSRQQIQLHLNAPQAFRITAALMAVSLPDQMNEDVFDAMRELVNMIAGNMKAVLAPGSQLSIAATLSDQPQPVTADVAASAAFVSEDLGLFWVTLRELPQN